MHKLSFDQWVELDVRYQKEAGPRMDLWIAAKTVQLICGKGWGWLQKRAHHS